MSSNSNGIAMVHIEIRNVEMRNGVGPRQHAVLVL